AGTVIAPANVSPPAARHSADAAREHLLPALLAAAQAIDTDLRRLDTNATDKQGHRHA
ncbi:IclR family transcriptional regulator, partial [Rhodococcus sp. BP-148]|nr:IclR family transcriptional regulator [Rhodococcus sp. BP-148]